jgi:2',3'-cyclic-nucleotide 2'-phosphodiesterase (5'-nucleotidase family)
MELARSLPPASVHLIVGGHTHTTLNEAGLSADNIVNGIPIVQAGKFGQFAGEVEISVHETATVTQARLRATIDLPTDDVFEHEHVRPLLAQMQTHRQRILGQVTGDDDLSADAVLNRLAAGESTLANFVTDALVCRCRAQGHAVDFAMIDATSINGGLRPGEALTFGDWFGVMPFSDTVCLLRLSGRQVAALLQDNARRVDRPGEPHTERGFLHFSAQVRYAIRLGAARGAADVEAIHLDGQPIATCLERTFVLATTSFLRGPAAAWEASIGARLSQPLFDLRDEPLEHTGLYVRDLLLDHIAAHRGVLPEGGAVRDGRLQVLKTHN